jgi:hypothetical protein
MLQKSVLEIGGFIGMVWCEGSSCVSRGREKKVLSGSGLLSSFKLLSIKAA